eukprot:TRINITY_DN51173_c0_g1_i1.p1 TRINITY_DN51173_c0_g1~~TRINITY_DN51173_c0_g1_i1.p1  ORF type:complete len:139 (+),score=18.54 TRINITY_DN51173_c0_g1_i1:40-417(+)
MYAFGVCATSLGVVALFKPNVMLWNLGVEPVDKRSHDDYTILFIRMAAMAAFNMGAYYCYMAFHEEKRFFQITVPFRFVTCAVFTALYVDGSAPAGVLGIAIWEGLGALWTAAALRKDEAARYKQ